MNKRNMSIELMRCCMMFGIVLLHVITQAGYFEAGGMLTRRFINILSPCVEGFVFISGYFGIRLKIGKCLRLIGLAFFYSAILTMPISGWRAAWGNATHNWFLYGYLVLMLMAPALNAALENRSPREMLQIGLPIVIAVYGWSYLCVIPGIKEFIPSNVGFAPLSFFTMIGIYMAARLYRLLELEKRLPDRWLWCGLTFASIMILGGFHHHNSPFSLIFVVCLFTLVKRLTIAGSLGDTIALIAPSMFGVFLIHGTHGGHLFFEWFQGWLIEGAHIPVLAAYLIDAGVVFAGCVVLDGLRRFMMALIRMLCS